MKLGSGTWQQKGDYVYKKNSFLDFASEIVIKVMVNSERGRRDLKLEVERPFALSPPGRAKSFPCPGGRARFAFDLQQQVFIRVVVSLHHFQPMSCQNLAVVWVFKIFKFLIHCWCLKTFIRAYWRLTLGSCQDMAEASREHVRVWGVYTFHLVLLREM